MLWGQTGTGVTIDRHRGKGGDDILTESGFFQTAEKCAFGPESRSYPLCVHKLPQSVGAWPAATDFLFTVAA
jgi:hypothetical protein